MAQLIPIAIAVGKIIATAVVTTAITTGVNYLESSLMSKKQKGFSSSSPTYGFGPLQTISDNTVVQPIAYGDAKSAGCCFYQSSENSATIHKLIAFADGSISGFTDIRLNDIPINDLPDCNFNSYLGDGIQNIDSRVPGLTQLDKAQVVGGLKYDAYLAITAKASEKLNSDFNVTAMIRGSLVRVYSTPTNYTLQYSNNPAWCILDFLTRYNACGVSYEKIDIASFIESAQYCDQLVNGQKRFTLNMILDESKSNRGWLQEMVKTCRGTIIEKDKIILKIEKPEATSQVFTSKQIKNLSIKWLGMQEIYDIVEVQHPSPEHEWAMIGAKAEAEEYLRPLQPFKMTVEIRGVTNSQQASGLAWFYQRKSHLCTQIIHFSVNKSAINRTQGDVIELTDYILEQQNKKFRIIDMREAQNNQIEITALEYNESIYSDEIGTGVPMVNVSKLGNPFASPPVVENFQAVESGWLNKDGTYIPSIDLIWEDVDYQFLSHYSIKISEDNGINWKDAGLAYGNTYRVQNVKTGQNYKVSVQAVNNKNIMSDKVITSITIMGLNNPPANVPKLTVTQNADMLQATITPLEASNIKYYQLRQGESWEQSKLVTTFIEKSVFIKAESEGTLTFWVKAVDNSGNFSPNATKSVVKVENLPVKNIILNRNEDFSLCQLNNMEVNNGVLRIIDLNQPASVILPVMDLGFNVVDSSSYFIDRFGVPRLKSVQVMGDYVYFADLFGTTLTSVEAKISIETLINLNISYNQNINNSIDIEYRTGVDGINWSNWLPFENKNFFGRYVEVKLIPKSINKVVNVEITSITSSIDVNDIVENIIDLSIPAQKTRINFTRMYYQPPQSISLFTEDTTGKQVTYRKSNVTKEYFDLELLDNSGNLIAGKLVKAEIRGY